MTAERLSALDASFLAVETPAAPMHVGWVSTYDLPEDGSRPRFPELFEHLAGRFAHAPRWRRKLAPVPLGITEPAWADDPDFDPAQHLLHARGSDLDAIVDEIFSEPLPRDRPLWQIWIADELEDSVVLIGKAHHCMVDGIAIVELGKLLLDAEPYEERPEAEAWEPAPVPSPRRAVRARRRRPRGRRRRARARAGEARELAGAAARRARPRPHAPAHAAPARAGRVRAQPRRLAAPPPRAHVAPARRAADDPAALRRHAQRRRARRLRGRAAALRRAAAAEGHGPRRRARRRRRRGRQPHLVRVLRAAVRRAGSGRAPRTRSTPPPRSAPTAARPRTSTGRSARSRSPRRRSSTCSPTRSRTRACRT